MTFITLIPPIFYNVKQYGAIGDGTTDDTSAITSAITAASSAGGGTVFAPVGVYITRKLTLPTGVWLVGSGYESSIFKLKSGSNSNLIETTDFLALTGTNTINTPYNFGILSLTLDGNKSNQSGTSHVVAIYGYGYTLQHVRIRNALSYGLWSEFGTQSTSPGNDSMEAFITDFKIHDNMAGGIHFEGPHDTQFHNGIVFGNGNGTGTNAIDIPTDQYGSGSVFSMVHVWGGNYDYAFKIGCTGITLSDCQLEGSLLGEVWIGANNCNIFDCKLFSLEPLLISNTVKGIIIANSAVNLHASCKMENMGGGVLDLTGSGGDHHIEIFADYYTASITVPSPAIIGSPDAQSMIKLHFLNAGGISTSDSTFTFPGAIKNGSFLASGTYGSGVGVNSGPNSTVAFLIGTGGDTKRGFLIYANSSSQSVPLFSVQNASFVDQMTVDKSGNIVSQGWHQLGGASTLFSGSGAPSNANGSNGDYYFRSDTPGTTNQRIYVKSSGSWTGIV